MGGALYIPLLYLYLYLYTTSPPSIKRSIERMISWDRTLNLSRATGSE